MTQLHTLSGSLQAHSPLWRALRPSRKRLRTVADGCGHRHNFPRTQPHPQTPKWNGNPRYAFGKKLVVDGCWVLLSNQPRPNLCERKSHGSYSSEKSGVSWGEELQLFNVKWRSATCSLSRFAMLGLSYSSPTFILLSQIIQWSASIQSKFVKCSYVKWVFWCFLYMDWKHDLIIHILCGLAPENLTRQLFLWQSSKTNHREVHNGTPKNAANTQNDRLHPNPNRNEILFWSIKQNIPNIYCKKIPLQISPGGLAPWFSSKEVYFWKLPTLEKQDPVTKQKNRIRKNQGLTSQLFFTTLTTNLVEKWILMIFSCFNMRKMRIPFPFLSGNFWFLKGFDVLQIPGVWSSFERFENFENFDSNTLIFNFAGCGVNPRSAKLAIPCHPQLLVAMNSRKQSKLPFEFSFILFLSILFHIVSICFITQQLT